MIVLGNSLDAFERPVCPNSTPFQNSIHARIAHCIDKDVAYLSLSIPVLHPLRQLLEEVLMHRGDFRDLVEYLLYQRRVYQSTGLGATQGVIVHLQEKINEVQCYLTLSVSPGDPSGAGKRVQFPSDWLQSQVGH